MEFMQEIITQLYTGKNNCLDLLNQLVRFEQYEAVHSIVLHSEFRQRAELELSGFPKWFHRANQKLNSVHS